MKALVALAFLLSAGPVAAYVPGRLYTVGRTQEKVIALTFDDGPGPITPKVLQFLKDRNIRATFFMEGTQIEGYSRYVRKVAEAGHEIGNHTYIHFNYKDTKHGSPHRLVHELAQTENSLRRALKDPEFKTRVVRMPYGYMNKSWLLPTLKEQGYALVHWSFGLDSVSQLPADALAKEYIRHAKPGAIFLFHDGGRRRDRTYEAMTLTVDALMAQGYRFVAAEDLLRDAHGL